MAVPSEPRGRNPLCWQGMERRPLCRYQQIRPGTRQSPRRSVPLGKGSLSPRADIGPFYYFWSLVDCSDCSVDRPLPARALEPLARSCRRWSYQCYWWSAQLKLKSMSSVNGSLVFQIQSWRFCNRSTGTLNILKKKECSK